MWTRQLQSALVLKDGRRIETIQDAIDFISSLPDSRRTAEHWDLASDALANAGRGLGKGFLDQDFNAVRKIIDTNTTGTIYLIQKVWDP